MMEPDRAIEIVQSLADGVDPHNGERFPFSSPYQQADTVRALGTTSVTSQSRQAKPMKGESYRR